MNRKVPKEVFRIVNVEIIKDLHYPQEKKDFLGLIFYIQTKQDKGE